MKILRNDPCPCGSGKKYKKCCLNTQSQSGNAERSELSPRFRFEPGSYGGPGSDFSSSALCYEQIAPGKWREHFCLVNPRCTVDKEEEASAQAAVDLDEASAAKNAGRTDAEFAAVLKNKGYMIVPGYRRADEENNLGGLLATIGLRLMQQEAKAREEGS